MKKVLALIPAISLISVAGLTAYASENIADGVYNIAAESDSSMFKITDCALTVKDGKFTVSITLSGTGYGKLFVGTSAEAALSEESKMIQYTEDPNGKYVYTFEIPQLGEPVDIAAFSTKKSEWYDRKITFKTDNINVPNSGETSGSDSEENQNQNQNPQTGAAGAMTIAIPAAAAIFTMYFSKKGKK